MSKYTEGKWGYEYSPANEAYEIAPIKDGELDWSNEICVTADDNKALAVLLSKAPEMLEMLKEAREFYRILDQKERMGKIDALITKIESE